MFWILCNMPKNIIVKCTTTLGLLVLSVKNSRFLFRLVCFCFIKLPSFSTINRIILNVPLMYYLNLFFLNKSLLNCYNSYFSIVFNLHYYHNTVWWIFQSNFCVKKYMKREIFEDNCKDKLMRILGFIKVRHAFFFFFKKKGRNHRTRKVYAYTVQLDWKKVKLSMKMSNLANNRR